MFNKTFIRKHVEQKKNPMQVTCMNSQKENPYGKVSIKNRIDKRGLGCGKKLQNKE